MSRGKHAADERRIRVRRVAVALGLGWLVLVLALALLPFGAQGTPGEEIAIRLQPFRTINFALRQGPGSYFYGVLILNILVFVPVGMLVPVIAGSKSVILAVGVGFLLSVAIEITQYAISVFVGYTWRNADVDDVIANTVGALLGYLIFLVIDAVASWRRDPGG